MWAGLLRVLSKPCLFLASEPFFQAACVLHQHNHQTAMAEIEKLGQLPTQAEEDALHASRLLSIEERPFQRVTKTLLAPTSLIRPTLSYLPSPPPEGEDDESTSAELRLQRFREDVLLDFANLESSITRIQMILSSNLRERERYAAEKAKITGTSLSVRENTTELRSHLVEAQAVLERRKGYDQLAAKILDDRKVKSRDEAQAAIEGLEKEIEGLQAESADYEVTWLSRREQFDSIAREGDAMIRLIKGIKDDPEVEKDEDEMEDVEGGEDESKAESPADGRSPRPVEGGDATPQAEHGETGGATPPRNKFLEVEDTTRGSSRVSSPLSQPVQMPDDVDMSGIDSRPSTADAVDPSDTPKPDVAMDDS